jgi:hypothetical protein
MRELTIPRGKIKLANRTVLYPTNIPLSVTELFSDNFPHSLLSHAGLWNSHAGMRVACTLDDTHHGKLLHVSVSYKDRDPTWAELCMIRDVFFPTDDVDCAMIMPRHSDYVNLHKHCFHIWQMPVEWGIR